MQSCFRSFRSCYHHFHQFNVHFSLTNILSTDSLHHLCPASPFRFFTLCTQFLNKHNPKSKPGKMGISGLLPLMKPATSDVKLAKLSGTVGAVDTNGWIHKACYSCGDKVYLKEDTEMYINYCINLCTLLRKHDITPILVFDGQSLPAKSETKAKRQKRKAEVRQKIEELMAAGDMRGARWMMRQCVDVTFEMVHRVIKRCRQEGIDCIVAPFEADAQITYLVNHGIADYAITEDSDLLVFGCQKVLYKLDRDNEKGAMLDLSKLNKCFKNFCEKRFQYMCILSGCDYLANIPNVGLGRARKFFETLNSVPMSLENIRQHLKTIPTVLNMVGKVNVTNEYIDAFVRAVQTFDHQLVFSPLTGRLTHLKNLNGGLARHRELRLGEYAGDFFDGGKEDPHFIAHYVCGNLHTKTLEKMEEDFSPFQENEALFSWFTEQVQKRINAKKTMANMIGQATFVPSSPLKESIKNSTIEKVETKRKVISESEISITSKRTKKESIKTVENGSPVKSSPRKATISVKKKLETDTLIEQQVATTENIDTNNRPSRNVFRRASTRTTRSSSITNGKTSAYFSETSTEMMESVVTKEKDSLNSSIETKSIVKAIISTKDVESVVESDDECSTEIVSTTKQSQKVDLNASLSSLDEEDKVILTSLNSTQSSGYYSQSSTTVSTQSQRSTLSRSSTTSNGKRKSRNSTKSTASKRSTRSSLTSPVASQDIRSFFSKRT